MQFPQCDVKCYLTPAVATIGCVSQIPIPDVGYQGHVCVGALIGIKYAVRICSTLRIIWQGVIYADCHVDYHRVF